LLISIHVTEYVEVQKLMLGCLSTLNLRAVQQPPRCRVFISNVILICSDAEERQEVARRPERDQQEEPTCI
jgi:hypothetical protein